MGAVDFTRKARGANMQEAYRNAIEEARDEVGHQEGYSGDINSCDGYKDVTSKFKASGKSAYDFADERILDMGKRDVEGIKVQGNSYLFYGLAPY